MFGALIICFAFDLGWRGYGWLSHGVLAMAFVAPMTVYTAFTGSHHLGSMFVSYWWMALLFEILFVLPGWGLGLGARKMFGGGKPYSLALKMSFDVE